MALVASSSALSYMVSHFWLTLPLTYLSATSFGILFTAATSLTLEQIPQFRGSIMSIQRAAWSGGATLGVSMGGLALLLLDYPGMGIVMGVLTLSSAFVFYFLAIDPTREKAHKDI
jgi:predicted MFS family arabinose efflux permease